MFGAVAKAALRRRFGVNRISRTEEPMKTKKTKWNLAAAVLAVALAAALCVAGCNSIGANKDAAKESSPKPAIVFMTDFGTANDAVAICRAVIIGINPESRIMDITHQVTPYSIEEASRFLAGVTP